jgi:hypothetical protein
LGTRDLPIRACDVDEHIRSFIEDKVKQLRGGRDGVQLFLKSDEIAKDVVEKLSNNAEGMYVIRRRISISDVPFESASEILIFL